MTEEEYERAYQRFCLLPDDQLESFDVVCQSLNEVVKKHYEINGNPFPGLVLSNRVLAFMCLELALEYELMSWNRE